MLKIMIVGYGFAGKNLHHRCLSKMMGLGWDKQLSGHIVVVDEVYTPGDSGDGQVTFCHSIAPVSEHQAQEWVVHICTPPDQHFINIKTALECGYRKILVEKPVASSLEEIQQLMELEQYFQAKILVVSNWPGCSVVTELVRALTSQQYGCLKQVTVVQNKSRFVRSRSRSGEHIFDIEMPHQVALALYLAGPAELGSATVEDMIMPDLTIPDLGTGNLTLLHTNGIQSELRSSLIHTVRERYVQLTMDSDYQLKAWFPTGGDDSYSRLIIYSPAGVPEVNNLIFDDPLTSCFIRAYHFFSQADRGAPQERPAGMDLKFNQQKVRLLEQAKRMAALNHNGTIKSETMIAERVN